MSSAFWSLKPKHRPVDEEAHGLAHVIDAVAPAVLVADHRRHAAFEAVAGHAMGEQELLAARFGQQLLALVHGDVAPAHIALLQCEIVGRALVGGERDAALGIALEADGAHLQPVVAGRQVLDGVLALVVGEHADGDLGLEVAGLHEGAAEPLAVGARDGAGDGRGIRRRTSRALPRWSQFPAASRVTARMAPSAGCLVWRMLANSAAPRQWRKCAATSRFENQATVWLAAMLQLDHKGLKSLNLISGQPLKHFDRHVGGRGRASRRSTSKTAALTSQ